MFDIRKIAIGLTGDMPVRDVEGEVAIWGNVADRTGVKAARAGLERAGFVVSIEQRISDVTARADVVFPAALIEEQSGSFLNWEHRSGRVNRVVRRPGNPMTDLRVLAALADGYGRDLGIRLSKHARAEFDELGAWDGARAPRPGIAAADGGGGGLARLARRAGELIADAVESVAAGSGLTLASWRQLIDGSASNDGAPALRATAKPATARVSPRTAKRLGLTDGEDVSVASPRRSVVLPLVVEPTMVDDTVWLPGNFWSGGLGELAVVPGDSVTVTPGGAE